jgi:hypothetical protein
VNLGVLAGLYVNVQLPPTSTIGAVIELVAVSVETEGVLDHDGAVPLEAMTVLAPPTGNLDVRLEPFLNMKSPTEVIGSLNPVSQEGRPPTTVRTRLDAPIGRAESVLAPDV